MIKTYLPISTQIELSIHGTFQDSMLACVSFDTYSRSYNAMNINMVSGGDYSRAIQDLGFGND